MGLREKSVHILNENFQNLAHLLFPINCLICTTELSRSEKHLCAKCTSDLPKMHLSEEASDSPVDQLFWGRVKIHRVYAWLIYQQNEVVKSILHNIKYKDNPQLARAMGEGMAKDMSSFEWMKSIDALIPVPIHPKKKFIRGYNQSEELAKGMSEVFKIPVDNHFLKRALHTESQTKKGRFARWDNIEGAFRSTKNQDHYEHIAIIDDVITTGATMERIIHQIHEKNPELRVSIISLAFAQ
jgi:competence protein ComFC